MVGKVLVDLAWRERYGVNVVLIERGNKIINVPGRDERIYPNDSVAVIGTDAELDVFHQSIMPEKMEEEEMHIGQIELLPIAIKKGSPLEGKDIRSSGIRYTAQGLVVGVERDGVRQLNPDSSFKFRDGDVVWIAGNKKLVQGLA